MDKRKSCLQLFLSFLRIGGFTFGGGYAMVPLIQREAAEKRHWVTDDEILEMLAISESTPGPIAINSATFVGYKVAGFWGSFCATFGVVLPSFVIIVLVSLLLKEFASLTAVRYALFGIRAGVCALLLKSFLSMWKKCPRKATAYLLLFAAAALSFFTDLNVIWIVIGAGLLGFLFSLPKGGATA